MNDKNRWESIEDFFLGKQVALTIIKFKISPTPL